MTRTQPYSVASSSTVASPVSMNLSTETVSHDALRASSEPHTTSAEPESPLQTPPSPDYASSYMSMTDTCPTVYHFIAHLSSLLTEASFIRVSEASPLPVLQPGKSYFLTRHDTALVAFTIPESFNPAKDGIAMVAAHSDEVTAKLKPVSSLPNTEGYVQLGVAPYGGGLSFPWLDRDLGIAGRVMTLSNKKLQRRLVNLNWGVAKIPSLAEHFGRYISDAPYNKETQMVPIIGLESGVASVTTSTQGNSFESKQPPRLVKAIREQLDLHAEDEIVSWELELYDTQPAALGGLNREFIFAPRIDDKLCAWTAIQALIETSSSPSLSSAGGSPIRLVGIFDNEEIGSETMQGAHSNFLPLTITRILESSSATSGSIGSANLYSAAMARSILLSADVTHAVNPNFTSSYLSTASPRLNTAMTVKWDEGGGNTTTDALSSSLLQRSLVHGDLKPAQADGPLTQIFHIRNDGRSGGTVGPMLSSALGVRAVDVGLAQLSMHSMRAVTGKNEPQIGVEFFKAVWKGYGAAALELEDV